MIVYAASNISSEPSEKNLWWFTKAKDANREADEGRGAAYKVSLPCTGRPEPMVTLLNKIAWRHTSISAFSREEI